MRQSLRVNTAILALALGLSAAPAPAQNATAPAPANTTSSSSSSEEVVGPRELSNFSINGTVTRQAETPPQRPQPAPRETSAAPAPGATPPSTTASASRRTDAPARAPVRQTAEQARTTAEQQAAAPGFGLAPPTAAPQRVGTLADPFGVQPASSADVSSFAPATDDEGAGLLSQLPWLLALLAALGAGAWYFRRQRSGYALAGAGGDALAFDPGPQPTSPRPEPKPRAAVPPPATLPPVPAASPRPSAPKGVVSTRLRPWVDFEFVPERAVIDGDRATIHFDIVLFNSGSAAARNVKVEARMFNAGPDQDQEIGRFFAEPVAKGESIPAIPPLQRMHFKSAVSMPRDQMRLFDAGGRSVFVPLLGFNALYDWSGGDGQTSASYLIGRNTDGARMAPFRADLGPRVFRGLDARMHSLGVRK